MGAETRSSKLECREGKLHGYCSSRKAPVGQGFKQRGAGGSSYQEFIVTIQETVDPLLQTVDRLTLAMVGIFVPQKSANATGQGFPLLDSPLPPQEATSIPLVMKFLSKLRISQIFKQTNGVGWVKLHPTE